MANNETSFRTELRQDFKKVAPGGLVRTLSDRFTKGLPDTLYCTYLLGPVFIELKFAKAPKRSETRVAVNLSPNQRLFLREAQRNNTAAGWCLCVQFSPREWRAYVGVDYDIADVGQADCLTTRQHGQPWDVMGILKAVHSMCL